VSDLAHEVMALAGRLASPIPELETLKVSTAESASRNIARGKVIDLVAIKLFAQMSGYSEKAVRHKIYRRLAGRQGVRESTRRTHSHQHEGVCRLGCVEQGPEALKDQGGRFSAARITVELRNARRVPRNGRSG